MLPNGKLAAQLARQGVHVFREEEPEITYDVFNLDEREEGRENALGGYSPERVALRRAMVLGHDRDQEIAIIRKGQALPAQSPVPPGVVGYDPMNEPWSPVSFTVSKTSQYSMMCPPQQPSPILIPARGQS